MVCMNSSDREKAYTLFTLSMTFAAGKRDFDHARGEGHEQRVTPAVDLHADDALVLHAVNAAPEHHHRFTSDSDQIHIRSLDRFTSDHSTDSH